MAKENNTPQGGIAPLAPKPEIITADVAPTRGNIEKASGELGTEELQKTTDKTEEQGFVGEKVDPRPNSDYSQIGGMPTVTNEAPDKK